MNARLIEKATTLKTTKGESQNAFKRINQAKVSAIRLTHTGSSCAALRAKTKQPEAGERLEAIGVREQPLTTHHLHHMSPSGRLEVLSVRLSPAAYAHRQFLCRPPGFQGCWGGPQSGGLRTLAEKCRPPG
jgi:hypothetical protein